MESTQRKKAQKEITAAAVVAQFLGIPVSPWANSCRVAEVIQEVIDDLKRQNENLKAANRLITQKLAGTAESLANPQQVQENIQWSPQKTRKSRKPRSSRRKKQEAVA